MENIEDQFKLPDLVASEVQEDTSKKEKEVSIKLKQPVSKPRQYFQMHFDKQRIKQGAVIQRQQQMRKAEEALKLKDPQEEEVVQEIDEDETQKKQLKKGWAERQARRVRGREEDEQQTTLVEAAEMGMKGGRKPKKDKKDRGSK